MTDLIAYPIISCFFGELMLSNADFTIFFFLLFSSSRSWFGLYFCFVTLVPNFGGHSREGGGWQEETAGHTTFMLMRTVFDPVRVCSTCIHRLNMWRHTVGPTKPTPADLSARRAQTKNNSGIWTFLEPKKLLPLWYELCTFVPTTVKRNRKMNLCVYPFDSICLFAYVNK